jgi:hypothetical protein
MPGASGDVRDGLERALTESAVVRIFVEETDALPLNAFGFISPVFAESLDLLERKL